MQAFASSMATLLAFLLFGDLAACGAGEHVRHRRATQAPLQAAAAGLRGPPNQASITAPDDWPMKLEEAVNAGLMPQSLALAVSPSSDGGNKKSSRVSMQLAQEELTALIAKLTMGCGRRFSAVLEGKSPSLHSFQSNGNTSAEGCESLRGSLCKTQAHMHNKAQDVGTARRMQEAVDVTGQSCFPKECLTTADLQPLASFLRGKAQENLPGLTGEVALQVDCTASGGGVASVGDIVTPTKATSLHSAAPGVASAPLAAMVLAYLVLAFISM